MTGFLTERLSGMPVVQIAWVVRDLKQSMSQWLNLGVGPFFTLDTQVPATYRGEPSSLSMVIGLAQAGPVQIELIQQTSDQPSAYTDAEPSGAAGFHHICRAYGDYDEAVAKLQAEGSVLVTEGQWGEGGPRFCYLDARDTVGCFIEICDDSEVGQKMYKIVREAAEGWDGTDPIRSLEPLLF
ncbi:VOC family protein [Pseudarthrobacter sp. fls2-241-R2A-168]|uniref:VOC family protein n=1 Tax=Pseudarthrobacter sp. fls2-241-R2A-168 TaxID=3040304 RepID=UPI002556DABF|nr:VOC family protein [Pseudarthrobacter sp. fls2-241-R2A-168]